MRVTRVTAAIAVAANLLWAEPARADNLDALKSAMTALQAQMAEMRQSYESTIAKLTARIDTLEKEKAAEQGETGEKEAAKQGPVPLMPTALPASETPPVQGGAAPGTPPATAGTLPATLPSAAAQPMTPGPARYGAGGAKPAQPASAGAFNPGIAAVLNGMFGSFSHDPDTAKVPGFQLGDEAGIGPRGFSLGESEVDLAANIDPYLYGWLVLSFDRENQVSVEEAYIQTTDLPWGFTAKAGRFFSGVGYLNERHAHDWDFIDAPLPYRAFLGTQYGDDGLQLRWLAPVDMFVELGAEAFRGDAFPAANAPNHGAGAFSGFVHFGDDINQSSSWLAGLSFLQTKASDRTDDTGTFQGKDNTGIASLVYKWAPNGNPVDRNLIVSGEYFFGNEDGRFNGIGIDQWRSGWYAQAVYQFMPRWRVGFRHDEVESEGVPLELAGTSVDTQGHTPNNNSLLLEYDTSEFGRFRLQFNRDDADLKPNNEILAAYTAIFGPHGAHRF
jgi:hypothetical protein